MSNYYAGEYKSAIARAKRVLLAAGLPWSRTTGRYSPFGFQTQKTTAGVRVQRVGCSDTIALHVYGYSTPGDAARESRRLGRSWRPPFGSMASARSRM